MAWVKEKLTDIKVRSVASKPPPKLVKLSDGRGLQLWLTPKGGCYWRFDYSFQRKRKLMAIGVYPTVSLAQARVVAEKARAQVAQGLDPMDMKRQGKIDATLAFDNTFQKIAEKLVVKKRKEGRAEATISKMEWIFRKLPKSMKTRPIGSIKTPEIIYALQKEEAAGNLDTARRMRTVVGEVFRFAIQCGYILQDPVQATRGSTAAPKPRHRPAILDPTRVGDLLQRVESYAERNPVTGSALLLLSLLYPRPGELRQADWSEIDLEKAIWTIPGSRMKMRQPHIKALSKQAIAILQKLNGITGPHGYLFPAVGRTAKCMSENTMNMALVRMGIPKDQHCPHGFRAMASTLLNASYQFSSDAIERSMPHQDGDAVRRAYVRDGWEIERQRMAQWWADYLDKLKGATSASSKLMQLPTVQAA